MLGEIERGRVRDAYIYVKTHSSTGYQFDHERHLRGEDPWVLDESADELVSRRR